MPTTMMSQKRKKVRELHTADKGSIIRLEKGSDPESGVKDNGIRDLSICPLYVQASSSLVSSPKLTLLTWLYSSSERY